MDTGRSNKLRVQREREFSAHHLLLGAANVALESAEQQEDGWLYHGLIAIIFSALALEALANAFGKTLVRRWDEDFQSCSPHAKIRVITMHIGLAEPDFRSDPWLAVTWLTRFRNRVAHARPESIRYDEILDREQFEKQRLDYPRSKLEQEINLPNARRAVRTVEDILDMWLNAASDEAVGNLFADGFSGSISSAAD